MFSALLPLSNYELSDASGGKVTQRLEAVKVSGLFPAGTCLYRKLVFFVLFLNIILLFIFCRHSSRSPTFFESLAFFQVAVTTMVETTNPGRSDLVKTCVFCKLKIFG